MNGVGNLTDNDGSGVLDLLLSPEGLVVSNVSAVRTMAWCGASYSGSRDHLKIAEAFLNGTLAAHIAVFVRLDRNADLVT
jgi:hypothetical protein